MNELVSSIILTELFTTSITLLSMGGNVFTIIFCVAVGSTLIFWAGNTIGRTNQIKKTNEEWED